MTEFQRVLESLLEPISLPPEEKVTILRAIGRLKSQEQLFVIQIFQKHPEKITQFWYITKKKFEYLKDGKGNIEEILKEEIELFSSP